MTDRYYYFATLEDAVSLSASHSSDYSQVCLDYISGSAISGALASLLYREGCIPEDVLNRVFQNNEAIFSNCLPLNPDAENRLHVVLPAPSSLHYEKGTKEGTSPYLNPLVARPDGKQLKQVRSGYLDSSGKKRSVERESITRTAIDPRTLGAREGQLFTLNFIKAGKVFWGFIDIPENTIPAEVMKNFLNSSARIGKSRSSEFGRVRFSLMDPESRSNAENILENPESRNDELYLWCLSDTEFINTETAQNTWTPQFSNLWIAGIPDDTGVYVPEKSFIRTGRLRYFNRKRNGHDSEKMVVKRGSVICFRLKAPISPDHLKEISKKGIGLSRHQGLGRVVVNPDFLIREKIDPNTAAALFKDLPLNAPQVPTAGKFELAEYEYLTAFAERKETAKTDSADYDAEGRRIQEAIISIYIASREYSNSYDTDQYGRKVEDSGKHGPSPSQWSVIRQMVIKCADPDSTVLDRSSDLFRDIAAKLAAENQRESARSGWDAHFVIFDGKKGITNTNTTFAAEFQSIIQGKTLGSLRKALDVLKSYPLSKLAELKTGSKELKDR